jgi:hypothetical protein
LARKEGASMTKRRAERLTGYEIRELAPERGLVALGAFEGENLVVKVLGRPISWHSGH